MRSPRCSRAPRRIDHLGAVEGGHLAPLVGDVVGHHERDAVALPPPDHRQRDPGVPRRRLEDDRVLVEEPALLEVVDQVLGDPVLDRARRVEHLELGVDTHVRVRRHARNLHERRVADRVEDAIEAATVSGQLLVDVPHRASAPGHRREQADLVGRGDRGIEPGHVAHVLAVDVDVDEPVEVAVVGQQLARSATDAG